MYKRTTFCGCGKTLIIYNWSEVIFVHIYIKKVKESQTKADNNLYTWFYDDGDLIFLLGYSTKV